MRQRAVMVDLPADPPPPGREHAWTHAALFSSDTPGARSSRPAAPMASTPSSSSSTAQSFPSTSQWSHPNQPRHRHDAFDARPGPEPAPALRPPPSASQSGTQESEAHTPAARTPETSTSHPAHGPLSQSDASSSSKSQATASQESQLFDDGSTQHPPPSSQSSVATSEPTSQPHPVNEAAFRQSESSQRAVTKTASFADAAVPSGRSFSHASPPVAHMDLATYPSSELLRILAMLLQQIATANDDLRPRAGQSNRRGHGRDGNGGSRDERTADHSHGRMQRSDSSTFASGGGGTRSRSGSMRAGQEGLHGDSSRSRVTTAAQAALMTPSSTLCFHARNVPTINVESYLLRILKYCPTTNEVFLSLLVYFDRMSRMGSGAGPGEDNRSAPAGQAAGLPPSRTREISASFGGLGAENPNGAQQQDNHDPGPQREPRPGMRGFAIDSFNVHRLIIAGLTVSSKFFSDVFYTNSRYAKVGGLPAHELNQLELQFLLLNDFHLVIPLEELQRYADQLLIYGKGQQQTRSIARPVAGTSDERHRVRAGHPQHEQSAGTNATTASSYAPAASTTEAQTRPEDMMQQ